MKYKKTQRDIPESLLLTLDDLLLDPDASPTSTETSGSPVVSAVVVLPDRVKGALDFLIVFPLLVFPSSTDLFLEVPLPITSIGVGGQLYWVVGPSRYSGDGASLAFPFRSICPLERG